MADNIYPRIILGLDVSTSCIGVSIVRDNGLETKPEIIKISHISPKTPKNIKGIESLFLKKNLFETEFLMKLTEFGITDVIIEEPLLSSNNVNTVATLLRFNGMIAESVYKVLHIVPSFISSYDARMFSFPDLVCLRKYNKKGEPYPLKHIEKAIKEDNIILFGAYPFDIDKKTVMMDRVNEVYDDIDWLKNKKDELAKQNYDACDSLICILAYINVNHYGVGKPTISSHNIEKQEGKIVINYTTSIWNKTYNKQLIIEK